MHKSNTPDDPPIEPAAEPTPAKPASAKPPAAKPSASGPSPSKTPASRLKTLTAAVTSGMKMNFLLAARALRELHESDPDLFAKVCKETGLGRRKAYYLMQIDRAFAPLDVPDEELLEIGWTKLLIIAPYVGGEDTAWLVFCAKDYTAHQLRSIARDEEPLEDAKVITLYLSEEQYEVFAAGVEWNGGFRTERGLLDVEDAVLVAMKRRH